MGIGSAAPRFTEFEWSTHAEPLLYLAPLVSIFYDALLFSDKHSIRRVGGFIRSYYTDGRGAWEVFVSKRRESIFDYLGELGFTGLVLLYCPVMAFHLARESNAISSPITTGNLMVTLGALKAWWFFLLLFLWLTLQYRWRKALRKL
jgi:hypothetical protein